jgi:hypothetical protein
LDLAKKSKRLAREEFLYTNLSFEVIQSFIDQTSLMCQQAGMFRLPQLVPLVEGIVMLIMYFRLTDRSLLSNTVIASFVLDH